MKVFRKWMRILHRDIGFFFVGMSLIYGLSGIALNHIGDWNPNYQITNKSFETAIDLTNQATLKENILKLVDELDDRKNYKQHYSPEAGIIKIFLKGRSSIIVDKDTGEGKAEFLKKRPLFYQLNHLHYNPGKYWKWFADFFAGSLIFLALSSLFMIKGKKGIIGRGGIYLLAGIIIPILFLVL